MPTKTTTTPEKYLITKNNDNNTTGNGTVTPLYPRTSIDNIVKSTTDNTTLQTVLDGKQSTIIVNPSTTTATLTGLGIDGVNYAVGGGGSGAGFPEIKDTNHVVIWNLDPGIYIYNYPNYTSGHDANKYIHWYGKNSTTASYRIDLRDTAPILLHVSELGSTKYWSFVSGNYMYGGYSSISGGAFTYKESLDTLHTMSFYDDNNNAGSFTIAVKIPRTTEYTSTQWKAALEAIRVKYGPNKAIPCSGMITYGLPQMQDGVPVILHSARIYTSNYKYVIEFGGCDMDNGSCGLYTCNIEDDWMPILTDAIL